MSHNVPDFTKFRSPQAEEFGPKAKPEPLKSVLCEYLSTEPVGESKNGSP